MTAPSRTCGTCQRWEACPSGRHQGHCTAPVPPWAWPEDGTGSTCGPVADATDDQADDCDLFEPPAPKPPLGPRRGR